MPVHTGKDSKGCYAQWGGHGAKYYYTCGDSNAMDKAKAKAHKQGAAARAHGYAGNGTFQYVTTNLKPVVRRDSMEGRDWVVVPTQMITEGVHNGSDGPIFYPAEELAKLPAAWNHKPVVVYHPSVNGQSVSACTPDQLTARKVGIMLNTKWNGDSKKLATETWLDPSRIQAVDNRVADTIESNEMMEVSTGLFMDLEKVDGEWNGEEYSAIAHNLQPDHLALLPDQKGACSIEDGAGFLRVNSDFSYSEKETMLRGALRADKENAWIEQVYDNYFIYEDEGKLYKQNYSMNNDIVSFDGLPKMVTREVTYKEVSLIGNDNNVSKKGKIMEKEKMVDALIKNEKTSWTEECREQLMALDDAILTNMHKDMVELSKPADNAHIEDDKDKDKDKNIQIPAQPAANTQQPAATVNTQQSAKPLTTEEYIQNAPPEIREVLEASKATLDAQRAEFIKAIMANERNTFTKEHLEMKKVDELKALAKLASTTSNKEPALYFGQEDLVPANNSNIEPLLLPVMNFEEQKKTA